MQPTVPATHQTNGQTSCLTVHSRYSLPPAPVVHRLLAPSGPWLAPAVHGCLPTSPSYTRSSMLSHASYLPSWPRPSPHCHFLPSNYAHDPSLVCMPPDTASSSLFQCSNRPLCVVSLIRSSTSPATLALSTYSQPHADVVHLEPHPHAAEGHLQDPRLARSTPVHAKPPRSRSHRRQPARPRLQTHMPHYVSVQLAPSINSASPRASHA